MTDKERRAYEDYMVSVHAARDAWETLRDESRAEGFEEGYEDGRAKGLAEGHVKGAEDTNRENARKMKALGLPQDVISQVTGLSSEELSRL